MLDTVGEYVNGLNISFELDWMYHSVEYTCICRQQLKNIIILKCVVTWYLSIIAATLNSSPLFYPESNFISYNKSLSKYSLFKISVFYLWKTMGFLDLKWHIDHNYISKKKSHTYELSFYVHKHLSRLYKTKLLYMLLFY